MNEADRIAQDLHHWEIDKIEDRLRKADAKILLQDWVTTVWELSDTSLIIVHPTRWRFGWWGTPDEDCVRHRTRP